MQFDSTGREKYILKDSKIIDRYLRAGKGEVILQAPSGTAHKYLFAYPKQKEDFPEGTIFIYALHNDRKFYLGMLSDDGDGFRRTARSYFNEDTDIVKGAKYITRMSKDQNLVDKTVMRLYQSGRCCRCGRELEDDESIQAGIGKKCLKKLQAADFKVSWDGNSGPF